MIACLCVWLCVCVRCVLCGCRLRDECVRDSLRECLSVCRCSYVRLLGVCCLFVGVCVCVCVTVRLCV